MTDARYQELVARLLDEEITASETAELAQAARQNPARARELRQHLALWELYAQRVSKERSVDIFVASCETRLRAEADSEAFVERVEAQLSEHLKVEGAVATHETSWERLRRTVSQLFAEWRIGFALAGSAALLIAGFFLWRPVVGQPVLLAQASDNVVVERAGTLLSMNRVGGDVRSLTPGPEKEVRDSSRRLLPGGRQLALLPMDIITVTGTAVVTIAYAPEKTRLELHPGTTAKLLPWAKGKSIELRLGTIDGDVARQRLLRPLLVSTPLAVARVLGTKFTLTTTTNATQLDVSEGKVRLTSIADGVRVDVAKGHYAIAATGVQLAALPQTDSILREVWTGIRGVNINNLLYHPDFPNRPVARDFLKSFETDEIQTNDFACRLVGYIHPPVSGKYTFWIAAKAEATLWLSRTENPAEKTRIARAIDQSDAMPQSQPITLVAGRRYFIQAIQKTARGSSYLAVSWQPPGGEKEVIPGQFLSPLLVKEKKR